jgi:hypothetical protein
MANCFFKKFSKIPLLGFTSPFCYFVARWRKFATKITLNYESKQNIAQKKKKKNSGMELATFQSQIGKVHVVNLVHILAKRTWTNRKHQSGETSK